MVLFTDVSHYAFVTFERDAGAFGGACMGDVFDLNSRILLLTWLRNARGRSSRVTLSWSILSSWPPSWAGPSALPPVLLWIFFAEQWIRASPELLHKKDWKLVLTTITTRSVLDAHRVQAICDPREHCSS
jgi:hypothetical protein